MKMRTLLLQQVVHRKISSAAVGKHETCGSGAVCLDLICLILLQVCLQLSKLLPHYCYQFSQKMSAPHVADRTGIRVLRAADGDRHAVKPAVQSSLLNL